MAKVLIIDSESEAAGSLGSALAGHGVRSHITADGTEGLSIAKTESPDAIVLCVELNRVSGYSICNKLKKDPSLAKIPLILTSSQATEETFEQHKKLKTRAEQYLKKPYDNGEVLSVLGEYIEIGSSEEVSLDDMDVDVEMELEDSGTQEASAAPFEDGFSEPSSMADHTQAMSASEMREQIALAQAAAEKRDAAKAADAARERDPFEMQGSGDDGVESPPSSGPSPTRHDTNVLVDDATAERARAEIRQLRQKVQKLEQTLEEKELEFNDRLLQESTRSREAVELKKKLSLLERDIAKHQQAAEKAELEAQEAKAAMGAVKADLASGEDERTALSDKIGELVDKVKELAAERGELTAQIQDLSSKLETAQADHESAVAMREKAKKAVSIAMQLLDETGLMH